MQDTILTDNLSKIKNFTTYSKNWNGYGAEPFSKKLIIRTINLIQLFPYHQPNNIVPTANDSIQLEYHKANGEYLEFEVFADRDIHMFKVNADATEESRDIRNLTELSKVIYSFCNKGLNVDNIYK